MILLGSYLNSCLICIFCSKGDLSNRFWDENGCPGDYREVIKYPICFDDMKEKKYKYLDDYETKCKSYKCLQSVNVSYNHQHS